MDGGAPDAPRVPRVVLTYAEGFPTALPNFPRLSAMLRELGEPVSIQELGASWRLEWAPIYPGVPIPEYTLRRPWRTDRRELLRVSLDGAPA